MHKTAYFWKSTAQSFSLLTRILHALVLLMVLTSFSFIYYRWTLDQESSLYIPLILWHKALGICIFVAALLFLCSAKCFGKRPTWPDSMPLQERILAHVVHFSLYVCLLLMPLSGYLMTASAGYPISVFGFFEIAPFIAKNKELGSLSFTIHQSASYGFLACMVLHLIGALKHHFIDKNNLLRRMC
jgi:cytochrome b561